ncbi:MAG: SDR family oxidoreductase, partial [Chitinophagaceae bacterium]|nr:SDR family oxidoreductase [Chitinophagaceae bacterium]
LALAAAGATVVLLGRNKEVADQRANEITTSGGQALAIIADVLTEKDLQQAADTIVSKYGRIDGLVNAAGGNQPGAVVQPDDDLFELNINALKDVLNLNLFGTLLPVQIFGRIMANTSLSASIVNVSSVSAKMVLTKVLGYSLAKAAIENYTKWFAVEAAKRYNGKIRMNAIVPGFFLTEQNKTLLTNPDGTYTQRGKDVIHQTPLNRFGNPEELTAAVTWLLSDASSFVVGSTVVIDGGFTVFSGV